MENSSRRSTLAVGILARTSWTASSTSRPAIPWRSARRSKRRRLTGLSSTAIRPAAHLEGRRGWAAFGNVTWNLTEAWAVILGGRFSHDDTEERWSNVYAACPRRVLGEPLQPGCELRSDQLVDPQIAEAPDGTLYTNGGRTAQTAGSYGTNSNSVFTPRVALRWKPNARWSGYATVSEGYKGSGVRLNPDSGFEHVSLYSPEKLYNYEIGFNARLLMGRLTVSGAVFRMDWRDMQVQVTEDLCAVSRPGLPPILVPASKYTGATNCVLIPIDAVENARRARSQGVELTVQRLLGGNWRVGASGGFLDAKFIDYLAHPVGTGDLSGDRLGVSPKWTVSSFAEYWRSIGKAEVFARGDVRYRSSVVLDIAEQPTDQWPQIVPGYTIANFNAGINYRHQSLTLHVNNLFNRQYYTGANQFSYGGTMVDVNPRTWFLKWMLTTD